jgi:hypothetical protein
LVNQSSFPSLKSSVSPALGCTSPNPTRVKNSFLRGVLDQRASPIRRWLAFELIWQVFLKALATQACDLEWQGHHRESLDLFGISAGGNCSQRAPIRPSSTATPRRSPPPGRAQPSRPRQTSRTGTGATHTTIVTGNGGRSYQPMGAGGYKLDGAVSVILSTSLRAKRSNPSLGC